MMRRLVEMVTILVAAVALCPPMAVEAAELSGATRLAGDTRYGTMERVVEAGFESSDWAIVASGDTFPDSLSAASVAGAYDAPIILTSKYSLSIEAKRQIERLDVKNVIVLGGEGAVSADVAASIEADGVSVERLAGATRVETSLLASKRAVERTEETPGAKSDTVIVASAANYPDGLSASAVAYAKAMPILLVDKTGLESETLDFIREAGFSHAYIMGGQSALPRLIDEQLDTAGIATVYRIQGDTRYETSTMMASFAMWEGLSSTSAVVASGENFPDALAGGALAGSKDAFLLLVDGKNPEELGGHTLYYSGHAYVLGGQSVISDAVCDAIDYVVQLKVGDIKD